MPTLRLIAALTALIVALTLRYSNAPTFISRLVKNQRSLNHSSPMNHTMITDVPTLRAQWRKALDELPSTPNNIPAFFLAHGQPMLIYPDNVPPPRHFAGMWDWNGPQGPLNQFLADFGPTLLEKYKPKGVVVFSAHWETRQREVTDYGNENPLLMDYFGFPRNLYKVKFRSRGSTELSQRVVDAFKSAGFPARKVSVMESRGQDGRGFEGPGLDHGVFVPFLKMWGSEMPDDIPIVEASLDTSLDPKKNWAVGKAVQALRKEGFLVIAGGLIVHSFEDGMSCFSPFTASEPVKQFNNAVIEAAGIQEPEARQKALLALTSHRGFRDAHPREDHFIPMYIAAGAGDDPQHTGSKVLSTIYGQASFAFGL